LALGLSYFPLTSPLILLARYVFDALPLYEMIMSGTLLILYVLGALYLAFKLFELGSLEYTEKLSFKRIFKT
ncbi:ABC transporter permease, partial [candidate division WWE3 bacterium]|nr:ABC transporter permease [candidate division WWE3 bacterium]